MKIPPKALKIAGAGLIVVGGILWPISHLTFAKTEPPVTLALSWAAMVTTGLAFYTAAQDGEEIDNIMKRVEQIAYNQNKIMEKLGIE